MTIDESIKIVEKESKALCAKLERKGVPVCDLDVDVDDIDICEPFIHLHINFDNDWFYKEIEKGQ